MAFSALPGVLLLGSAGLLLAQDTRCPTCSVLPAADFHMVDRGSDDVHAVSLLQSHVQLKVTSSSETLEDTHNSSNASSPPVENLSNASSAPREHGETHKHTDVALSGQKLAAVLSLFGLGTLGMVILLKAVFPDAVKGFLYIVAYIATSSALINMNKYVMGDTVFPHAIQLTTLHMTATWIGLFSLYCISPSFFPSMANVSSGPKIVGAAGDQMKYFIPLGIFFAISLYCSNSAYKYCGVAFLQFMKETNIVPIFLISVLVGLQQMTLARIVVIIVILGGSAMTITGELNFVLIGFLFQLISQLAESSRNVLGEWMMTANFRLDPLTYTMSMAPFTLIPLAIATAATWQSQIPAAALAHSHVLLVNMTIAVVLNICVSCVISTCSATSFVLAGVVKDLLIVCASSFLFGDVITFQQRVGFAVTLSGIAAWTSIKLRPDWWTWLSLDEIHAEDGAGELLKEAAKAPCNPADGEEPCATKAK
jgi:hypothetical protein